MGVYSICQSAEHIELLYVQCWANNEAFNQTSSSRQGAKRQQYYARIVYFSMCALFQPYPPTINFLECWMHLSDGSAKVVTLSHHRMRASNDCLREIAVSSNVFENSSRPCLLFLYLLRSNSWRVFFDLCYQFVLHCGAQSCEMAVWSCRVPTVEIPLPFMKILTWDLQLLDNFEDQHKFSCSWEEKTENGRVVTQFSAQYCSCTNLEHYKDV